MGFKFAVSNEALEGRKPVPAGIYTIRLVKFAPKKSKNGDSVNLNPQMDIQNPPAGLEKAMVFDNLNDKGAWTWPDFVHAFGLEMESENGQSNIPGNWDGVEADPKTWKYSGPLLGRTAQVEIAIDSTYDPNNPTNKIRKYICAVPNCTHKHSNDLLKNNS